MPTNVVVTVRTDVIISTAIVFRPMICTKAAWATWYKFEETAVTWDDSGAAK